MANKFAVEAEFKGVDKFSKPLRKMQNNVNRFAQSADRDFKRARMSFSKFGGAIKVGVGAIAAGTTAMGVALLKATKSGVSFERAMGRAAAKFEIFDRSSESFKKLNEAAILVGSTTEKTSTDAAQALEKLGAAGIDVDTSIKSLATVIDLSTATGIELGRTSEILTKSMGAYGLITKDATQNQKNFNLIANTLLKTSGMATVEVEELFETIKQSAKPAKSLGIDVFELSGMFATLAQNAKVGGEAGTALRNVMLRLSAPTGEASNLLRDLEVNVFDDHGKARKFSNVLNDLNLSLSDLNDKEKQMAMSRIFGVEAIVGAQALIEGTKATEINIDKLKNAGDVLGRATKFIRSDTQGAIDQLNSTIDGLSQAFFKLESNSIIKIIKDITQEIKNNKPEIIGFMKEFSMLFKNIVTLGLQTIQIFKDLGKIKFFKDGEIIKGEEDLKKSAGNLAKDIGINLFNELATPFGATPIAPRPIIEDVEIEPNLTPIVEPVIISPVERSERLRNDSTNKVIISPEKGLQAKPDGDLNPNVTIEKTGGF